MKRRTLAVLMCFALVPLWNGAAQDREQILVGPLTIEQLLDLPGWFGKEFMEYSPQMEYVQELGPLMKDARVVCILGTWCSDSRREVPRLIRLMQMINVNPDQLVLVGTDRAKRSPGGEHAKYKVEYVPTMIVEKNGAEVGRIVETPLGSLEKHMLGMFRPSALQVPPPPDPNSGDSSPDRRK